MKKIAVFGAGFVSRPLVKYLAQQNEYELLVYDQDLVKANTVIRGLQNCSSAGLNVNNTSELEAAVKNVNIAVSLLPASFHVVIARVCLKFKVHLVTTSYVSPEMKALDAEAKNAGVLFLNEVGLDPGLDHMSAMKIISDVHAKGGTIIGFESSCGGLPSPKDNNNPMGYKFSWSPRGVLLAARQPAVYLKDGEEKHVHGEQLFKHYWMKNVDTIGDLEVYPNRDSLKYRDLYGLKDARTFFRGTFRYPGWCDTIDALAALGYLKENFPNQSPATFLELTAGLMNVDVEKFNVDLLADFLKLEPESDVIKRMEWLGLLSNNAIKDPVSSPLDALVEQMQSIMKYEPNEQDMIVLQHEFTVKWDNNRQQHICSCLVEYGEPGGDLAMARTVGLPAATAVHLIAQKAISITGVHIPILDVIFIPVLAKLKELQICFKESNN